MASLGALLISFIYLLIQVAIVLLIAYAVVWACRIFKLEIDGDVYRVGKIVVGLVCLLLVVIWLFGVLGGTPVVPHFRLVP